MGGGRGSPGILGRDCAQSLNKKLGLYTGSSVPTREAPSLQGMLGPYLGFLVPTWDPWSLHRILGAYTGCSVPTWDSWSLLGMLGPYTGCLFPTRDALSPHRMLSPYTGCSVPTRAVPRQHCKQYWHSCFPRGLCSRGALRGVCGPQRHIRGLQAAGSTPSAWARVQHQGLRAVPPRSCQGRPVCLHPAPRSQPTPVWPCLTSCSCLTRAWTQGPSG